MHLYLTRHGVTDRNNHQILQSNDNIDINKVGRAQAAKLTLALKNVHFSEILSSDLQRCKSTTEIILKEIGGVGTYLKLLREKDNGDWGGTKINEKNWESLEEDFETRKPPKGESLREAQHRAKELLQLLMSKHNKKENNDKNILIVSHGAFLKLFIGMLLSMKIQDAILNLKIDYCSLSKVKLTKDAKTVIKYINKTNFLDNNFKNFSRMY